MQIERLEVIPFAVPIRSFADAYIGIPLMADESVVIK